MQFPVPQFTEVEDKLIGPLSIRQFFILFAAGILIFAGYSATKSTVALVILFIIFGLPALGLTFAKVNGRPAYRSIGFMLQFFSAPRAMVFHKQASSFPASTKLKDSQPVKIKTKDAKPAGDAKSRLREVQGALEKQAAEERELIGKLK